MVYSFAQGQGKKVVGVFFASLGSWLAHVWVHIPSLRCACPYIASRIMMESAFSLSVARFEMGVRDLCASWD